MSNLLQNVIFSFIFFGLFTFADTKKCIQADGPKATKCLETFEKLGELAGDYDITNKTSATEMNKICGKFKRCTPFFECETDVKLVYAINITTLFCDAVGFFSTKFLPCQIKLDSDPTECTQNWNPYPEQVKDKKKMAEIQKEACKNYFGKDNCMKEEIIDSCGAQMWNGFRKHYLALNTITGTCHFKEA